MKLSNFEKRLLRNKTLAEYFELIYKDNRAGQSNTWIRVKIDKIKSCE